LKQAMIMIETANVKQDSADLRRRWFSDDYFDLIVWEEAAGEIIRFELCYGKFRDERALVWDREAGYSHLRVDDGENAAGKFKMSPIYAADGLFDRNAVADGFLAASVTIDQAVASFVYNKLKESPE